MVTSKRFQFKEDDLVKVGTNALIFSGPAVLVLLADLANQLPAWLDSKWAAVAVYLVSVVIDALKKWLTVNKYR